MNLMIDLETLCTRPSAVVTQVGLVAFDSNGISDRLKINLDIQEQINMKRTIFSGTLMWWMEQSEGARSSIVEGQKSAINVTSACLEISQFCKRNGISEVWGNGASFDVVILESLMNDIRHEIPWKFWNHRDMRTMAALPTSKSSMRPSPEIAHDALSDSEAQAQWLINMAKAIDMNL